MTSGSIYHRGWVPHTNIAIATAVRVYATDAESGEIQQVGVLQNFNVNQRRSLQRVRGVCYGDKIAEILPGNTDYTITCSRAALYTKNIIEVFGFPAGSNQGGNLGLVRMLSECKVPFDIKAITWYHNAIPEEQEGGFTNSNSLAA